MEKPEENDINSRHPELWDEPDHIRKEMARTMGHIYSHAMTTTSGGNMSVIDSLGNIWITPSGTDKGSLLPGELVCVAPDGNFEGLLKPSMEYPLHRAVYNARPDLRAVIHAHPPVLTSFSIVHRIPDTSVLSGWQELCGTAGYAAYAIPGSDMMAENVASEFKKGHNAVMMENHAVVTGGKDLAEALARLETLEYCARTVHAAGSTGETAGPEISVKGVPGEVAGNHSTMPVPGSPSGISVHESGAGKADTESWPSKSDTEPGTGIADTESGAGKAKTESRPSKSDTASGIGKAVRGMSPDEERIAREICLISARACSRGLMYGFCGDLSARSIGNSFLMTREGVLRYDISTAGISGAGGAGAGRLAWLHDEIYRRIPSVNAVITAQPPYLTAFALTGREIDVRTIPESWLLLKEIHSLPSGVMQPGREEIHNELAGGHPVILIRNGPVIVTGESLLQAFDRLEVAEMTAMSLILAQPLGKVHHIREEQTDALGKTFLKE